jgi:hypothetical protein
LQEHPVAAANAGQFVEFGNDSRALVAWAGGNSTLILAFSASQKDNSSMTESISNLSPVGPQTPVIYTQRSSSPTEPGEDVKYWFTACLESVRFRIGYLPIPLNFRGDLESCADSHLVVQENFDKRDQKKHR